MTDSAISVRKPQLSRNGIRAALLSGLFVLITAGLLASPAAGPMRYGFPALAFIVSFFIFRLSRPFYAGFVVWLWMLAPLVRRLVEYRAGGSASLIIASPFLACAVPVLLNLGGLGELLSVEGYPVLFAGVGISYGLGIGLLLHNHLAFVATQFALWIAPLLFIFFLVRFRTQLPEIRASEEKAFIWGTAVIGAYGLYQYQVLAPWDALWMETAPISSIGVPLPGQLRVFSTMNSPQALAIFVAAGILIALRSRSKIKWLAIPLGTVSLLLSQSRTAWLGFVLGLIYLVAYLPTRQKLQLAVLGALSFTLVLVALQGDQKNILTARLQTLSSPSEDSSFSNRINGYAVLLPEMLSSPFGAGIGLDDSSPNSPTSKGGEGLGVGDSSVIAILFNLGLPGTLIYLTGIGSGIVRGFRRTSSGDRDKVLAFRSLFIAVAVSAVATNLIEGGGGFLTWLALTLCNPHLADETAAATDSQALQRFTNSPLAFPVGNPAPLEPRI
jgi:hypothetical protein